MKTWSAGPGQSCLAMPVINRQVSKVAKVSKVPKVEEVSGQIKYRLLQAFLTLGTFNFVLLLPTPHQSIDNEV